MANARHSNAASFVQQRLFSAFSDLAELEHRIADLLDEQKSPDQVTEFSD